MSAQQKNLKQLLKGIIPDTEDCFVSGITNDSRQVQTGDLFLACVGETVDARQFIADAIAQGAASVLYQQDDLFQLTEPVSVPCIPISDLNHLQGNIAAKFYEEPSKAMRCIGVTGTNGKTTCTQWIAQALSELNLSCGVIGTLGSGFPSQLKKTGYTTPDPVLLQKELAELRGQGAKALAMEVSSHALAQGRVNGLQFDIAVYTQLSRDHLDYHGDMDSYANAKALLFKRNDLRYAVINQDDAFGRRLAADCADRCDVMTYSLQGDVKASIVVTELQTSSQGFTVNVKTPWGSGRFKTALLGTFNISNLLAVLGVLGTFEVPFTQLLTTLESLAPVPGRMQLFGGSGQPSVIVDYSHTPDALAKALQAIREHCEGKLWCVFGCGGDRDRGKRPEMAKAAETFSDVIVVTNDNPRTESPQQIADDIMAGFSESDRVKVILDRAKAIADVIQSADPKDSILIAGKGHETVQIVGDKMLPFSDSQQVEAELTRGLDSG